MLLEVGFQQQKIEMTIDLLCLNLLPMVEKTNKHQEFADRLTAVMNRKGLSVKELSEACGGTYEMARRYTIGTAKPRDEKLSLIADWIGVDPAWLDYGDSRTNFSPPHKTPIIEAQPSFTESESESTEFSYLSEEEKRLVRVFRKFPDHEAKNMLLAFEMRYKQLYDFYAKYTTPPSD